MTLSPLHPLDISRDTVSAAQRLSGYILVGNQSVTLLQNSYRIEHPHLSEPRGRVCRASSDLGSSSEGIKAPARETWKHDKNDVISTDFGSHSKSMLTTFE